MTLIVFKGKTKKGKDFIIRYPEKSDLDELLSFINELSREKTFILYQGEIIKMDEEIKYLENILKEIDDKKRVHLLAFFGKKLIGGAEVGRGRLARRHIGNLHIAVLKDFRGEGIGRILMSKVIEEALRVMPDLRLLSISVFSANTVARSMYEKFGFVQYGRLPDGVKHDKKFEDELFLFKKIENI